MNAVCFAGLLVYGDFTDHRVGAQGQVAGVHGWVDQAGGGIEGGMDVAAAFALAGTPAVTAAAILIVLETVGGYASAILGDHAVHFLQALLQGDFGAIQLGGSLEDAVGKVRQVFFYAGDSEIEVHLVVVGGDIAVADGPILAKAVAVFGLEIVVGEAEGEAAPDVGLAAEAAGAHPGIVCAGEGVFAFVDHDVFYVIGVADIVMKVLRFFEARAVGRLADGVLVIG